MLHELFKQDCYMLDIETNGLSPITNGMTSFALVKFKLNAPSLHASIIDARHFRINTAVNIDMFRVPNKETRQWRRDNGVNEIENVLPRLDSVQDIVECFGNFHMQTKTGSHPPNLFALHTEFDIAFVRGYFEAAGEELTDIFPHRNNWEIASLIRGMNQDLHEIRNEIKHTQIMESVSNQLLIDNFKPHNAVYDCIRQVEFLRMAAQQAGVL